MATADAIKSKLASLAIHFARRKSEVTTLMDEVRETWSERAAIRQYLAGIPLDVAEHEAVNDTIDMFNARVAAPRRSAP